MTHPQPGPIVVPRASRDGAARRACLRCRALFDSEGFGERICPRCKGSAIWKSSAPLRGGRDGQGRKS
jgi:hypothetical protein